MSLGGALIGFVLPLASALSQTVSLLEFAAWALLAGVIQIVSFIVVSRLVYKDLAARIEAGEMAAAHLYGLHLHRRRPAQRRLHDGVRKPMST